MAAIHKGKRSLKRQVRRYWLMSGVCLMFIIAYGMIVIKNAAADIQPLFHLLPVIWLWGVFHYYKKAGNFRAGFVGEAEVLREIRQLPASYHVFTNFVIEEKGIRDEADFVIVGENGIFVIEVKNYCGTLQGDVDDFEWKQTRLKKGGKKVTKKIANLEKQANWHTVNVKRLLQNGGYSVHVKGMLVFTSPHVRLDIEESESLLVFKGCGALAGAIADGRAPKKLDKKQVKEIARYLAKRQD